jgi:site-specific recombinase XerD
VAAIFCKRELPPSPFVFTSMRKGPFSTAGHAWARRIAAGLAFQAHPHMLRHACGFTLVNKGTDTQTYLGHKNIQHTVRYTELMATRFKNLWRWAAKPRA